MTTIRNIGSIAIATQLDLSSVGSIKNTGTLTLPTSTDTLIGRATTDTMTNKTLTAPVISTISNTGTLTLPTSTDTLVGRATTDTMTNKTLTAPVIATIVNTGTLTLPTSTDTLVARNTADTLLNKTLTDPIINSILDANTNTLVNFTTTAAASTFVNVTNSTTAPTIASAGVAANIDLTINPKGTGQLVLDGLKWPATDGTSGFAITTDGAGNLSFAAVATENIDTVTTTDATVTTIRTIATTSNTCIFVNVKATARNTANTQGAGYVLRAVYLNNAGVLTQIGIDDKLSIESNSAWEIATSISTTNILIRVTGVAATTINWTTRTRALVQT